MSCARSGIATPADGARHVVLADARPTLHGARRARFPHPRHVVCSASSAATIYSRRSLVMLSWALAFFIIAIIAAVFGFTGIAAGAAEIAKILFVVFVVLFLVSLVAGLLRRP